MSFSLRLLYVFQVFRFMQFAGSVPPTSIVVLFVTFFPLQGFFNLVVYMFPRILRYFEEGVPLTQSFRMRSNFLSSLTKKRPSHKSTEGSGFSQEDSGAGKASPAYVSEGGVDDKNNSQVSFAEGIVDDGEGQADGDKANEGNIEEGNEDDGKGDGEKDAIDELERIVEA